MICTVARLLTREPDSHRSDSDCSKPIELRVTKVRFMGINFPGGWREWVPKRARILEDPLL